MSSLAEAIQKATNRVLAASKGEPPPLASFVQDTVNFELHEWQEKYLCPVLERCRTERGLRVAIHAPPRYGKTIIVSQRFPAWLLGCDPTHRVALAMHNEEKAARMGYVVKGLMLHPTFRGSFPSVAIRKDAASGAFFTPQREALADGNPSFQALGMLSGTAGFGADTWIIDDPYKSREDAFSEVINEKCWTWWEDVRNRIAEDANVILMFHRWHDDDMAGRILASDKFEELRFPAIADGGTGDPTGRSIGELLSPIRSREWLKEREDEDPKTFVSLFQGRPRPDEGAFFRREWFKTDQYAAPKIDVWVRAWDLAFTSKESGDYTVGALVGYDEKGGIHIRDIKRFRAEWPEACELIAATIEQDSNLAEMEGFKYQVGVEAVASQSAFYKDLVRKGIADKVPVWPITFKGKDSDKKSRASLWAQKGPVLGIHLHEWERWDKQAFLSECLAFTGLSIDKHDDQVDAVSNACLLLYQLKGGHIAKKPEIQYGSVEYYRRVGRRARSNSDD